MTEFIRTILIGVIVSVTLALSVSFMVSFMRRWAVDRRDRFVSKLEKEMVKIGDTFGPVGVTQVLERDGDTSQLPGPSVELINRMKEQVFARVAASPEISKDKIREEIHRQSAELQSRIAKIEARFPEEAKLEKIASINDALLSERIDQLSQQVKNLEKRLLSKWDVALTVSTIIAGIAFVVAATYGVMEVIGNAP